MIRTARTAVLAAALAVPLYAVGPPPEVRVVLIGDSLAYGAGDESGKGIGGRLEPELRSRGVGSAAIANFGVTGASTRDVATQIQKKEARAAIARANVIVLSAGANDLRRPLLGEEPMRSPLVLADQVLRNLESIVAGVREINPDARILILGGYAPVPRERAAILLEPLVVIWDAALESRFLDDPLVSVVRMSDLVDRPERLSRIDSFHPGGEAYQDAARRIAGLLTTQ